MYKLIFLLLLIIPISQYAQTNKTVSLKAGQVSSDVMKFDDIYKYPEFKTGVVEFLDGRKTSAKLNYNFLLGEMDFINKRNDTLSLAEAENLKWVIIETDTFYYADKYIQSLASYGSLQFAKNQEWKVIRQDQLGAFGQKVLTSNINFEYLGERRHEKLTVKEDVNIALKSEYYLAGKKEYVVLNKKNLLKKFPKSDKQISDYMNQQNISLDNEEHLLKLFEYLRPFVK